MATSTQSPLLAGKISDCCVRGVKHSGEPTGKQATIAGVETYVSEPAEASASGQKKVIFYFSDIHGPFYINNKLLADYFADEGFTTLALDYFHGDTIDKHEGEAGFDMNAWFGKSKAQADEAVPKWVKAVKETYGADSKYFAVGYCFGAPYVLQQLAEEGVNGGAIAHPAAVSEEHFKSVKKPLLLLCAESDYLFTTESRHKAEAILSEVKATYLLQVFGGVGHGFAVRGDMSVEGAKWAKEEAARGVVGWFKRFSA